MKIFRSFSFLTKIAFLALLANGAFAKAGDKIIKNKCPNADTEYKDFDYPESLIATVYGPSNCIHPPSPVTFNKKANEVIAPLQNGTYKGDQSQMLKEMFKAYCDGGSQKLSMDENIQLIIPKIPAGIPLDQATNLRAQLKSFAEERAKNIIYSVFPPERGSGSFKIDKKENYKTDHGLILPYFFALPVKSTKELTNHFKESFDLSQLRFTRYRKDNQQINTQDNQFALIYVGKQAVVGWTGDAKEVPLKPTGTFSVSYEQSFKDAKDTVTPKRENQENIGEHGQYVALEMGDHVVLREITFFDLMMLVHGFSIAVPEKQEQEILGEKFGLYSDGKLQASNLLSFHDRIWRSYIKNHLIIKSSPNDDPAIVNETLSLDLGPFCKFGLLSADLNSK